MRGDDNFKKSDTTKETTKETNQRKSKIYFLDMATQTAEADSLAQEESIQKDPAIPKVLLKEKHVRFFKQMLNMLPSMYEKLDSSRLTVLYFSLSGKFSIRIYSYFRFFLS